MGTREDKGKQVVYRHEKAGYTEVWHKNKAGNTDKDLYRKVNHGSGTVTDRYGRVIHKGD
jgi:hypothetical protein